MTFVDDHGDTVDPYSWCGNVVLISFGAMWEGGSQAETGDLQSLYDELHGSGFIAVQALIENVDSQTPSSADLTEWEQTYGVSFPVVADPNSEGLYSFASGSIGLPYRVLVNREMQVTDSNGDVNDADIRALMAE
jgi:glutathione peroxidase-family protein